MPLRIVALVVDVTVVAGHYHVPYAVVSHNYLVAVVAANVAIAIRAGDPGLGKP